MGIQKIIFNFFFINNLKAQNANNNEGDDWEYLKKTISREGRYVSDDFIRYHQITDQIVEDEDNIINSHMNIIKVKKFFN